jgi:hypothetical protein
MKKYIAKIREWLRSLIAEEVAKVTAEVTKVETSLAAERSKMASHATVTFEALEKESARLLGEFEAKLRETTGAIVAEKNALIAELQTNHAALAQTVAKISHWKADAEMSEADHSLKMVK